MPTTGHAWTRSALRAVAPLAAALRAAVPLPAVPLAATLLPACGDVSEVQVPLIPARTSVVPVPVLERAPPQATVNASLAALSDAGVCASVFDVLFELSLPEQGAKPDGDPAPLACTVNPLDGDPDVFAVEADLVHPRLPHLAIAGRLRALAGSSATIDLTAPDGTRLAATCEVRADSIAPGRVAIRATECSARADGVPVPECELEVEAMFEGCAF